MKNVLVTGGTGFLGSYLVRRLLGKDKIESVVIVSTNIRFRTSLKELNIKSPKLSLVKGDVRDYVFENCNGL